jgi:hypothetical protein
MGLFKKNEERRMGRKNKEGYAPLPKFSFYIKKK